MSGERPAVAAGRFYPDDAAELATLVDRLLDEAEGPRPAGELRALVVPHAGYLYSGAVAARGFALVRGRESLRVALLGPSHFTPLRGTAVTEAAAWRTPLGSAPVDDELRRAAVAAGAVCDDNAHRADHALEVELPFLQRCVRDVTILPVAVGTGADDVVAAVAEHALVIVSTDLSHYHDDATARALDRRTTDAVLALDEASIRDGDACGAAALRNLMRHARDARWSRTVLDLRTSADATGDVRRVVGYAAFALMS